MRDKSMAHLFFGTTHERNFPIELIVSPVCLEKIASRTNKLGIVLILQGIQILGGVPHKAPAHAESKVLVCLVWTMNESA